MIATLLSRLTLGCVVGAVGILSLRAQELPRIDPARRALLIHGNFCGPGNRGPGHPPVDALDRACAHHDACSPPLDSGRLPRCSCHDRLHAEAGLVARDPRTPVSVRQTAQFISDGALALPCDP